MTGSAGGIGASIVSLFLSHGAKVAALDITDSTLPADDSRLDINCNVTSEDSINDAVRRVLNEWTTIDVLVNCAGVMDSFERVDEMPTATWTRCFAVNVNGPFHLMRAVLPHFLSKHQEQHKGAIVNLCSTAALRGAAAGVAYTASKHALLGLSRSTAWMYAQDGVRCNAVCPGGTQTNIVQNSGVQIVPEQYGRVKPYLDCQRKIGQPDEVARAVLFLATADAVNGAELAVDYGWSTC